jgi:hypothetical protein
MFIINPIAFKIPGSLIVEQPILNDENQYPTEEIIVSHLGKSRTPWKALFEYIHAAHPDFTEEWRYYRDGKSWLLKVTFKKKTIFWLSIIPGAFKTTFYFTEKAKEAILSSNLSEPLKNQFRDGKSFGKIKGITVIHSKKQDIEDAKILIDIKLRIK